MPIFIKQDGTQQNYTNEQWAVGSNTAALNYVSEHEDVQNHAVATAAALGIVPGHPEYNVTIANIGKEHFARYGRTEVSRNSAGKPGTNVMFRNLGYSMVDQANAVGATPNLVYQGSMADRFIQETPRADATKNPDTVVTNEELNNRADVAYGRPVDGDDTNSVVKSPGMMSPGPIEVNVDLAPIQSAISGVAGSIGTPTTAQTNADQTTLMGQTAGLATGQQGIRDVVNPLGEQVTGIRDIVTPLGEQVTGIGTQIGTADTDAGQTDLFAGQRGIMSGIGTAGTGTTPGTGLVGGQANIQAGIGTAGEGQTDLFAGQAGLQSGQQAMQATQAGLEAGQLGLGTQIGALGTAGVTGEDGTVTQEPTGLYAGQAGLMSGQTGLGTQLTGVGRDITAELGDVSSALGGQIGAFQTAAEQYQRGATTQRGDIQGTQRANQAAMTQQVQGVGQQTNRTAEMMAQQRQQPAVQQQAAQFAQSAPRATPSNQQIGPMGPMSVDPRDAIIRQLMANRTGLMNRRPI